MKTHALLSCPMVGCRSWLAVLGIMATGLAIAFPPAPNHTFYGVVRDEMGDPIVVTNAVVTLETITGVQVKTTVTPNLAPGMNYRLSVPMDSGLTSDNYKPTALRPTVSFTIKVKIGTVTYLPLELHGSYANLGKPAQRTHLDLTLGEDSDGDGLPDAWERALIDMLGGGLTLADIRPGDDSDHDGMTNLQEYLAGTYAFDPEDGFRLAVAGQQNGHPLLEFLAIRGRTYTLLASSNLTAWAAVPFRVEADGTNAPLRESYAATDVSLLRVEAVVPQEKSSVMVFKAQVQ